jgi:adenylate kinase
LDRAIFIELSPEEVVERLAKRRLCRQCGAIYHLTYNPPKKEKVCDQCGGQLYQRDDDQEKTIRNRLSVYEELTDPLRRFYEKKSLLLAVDGGQSKEGVFADILRGIDGDRK